MKKNTHGNNKWQRKICSRTMKKVVETNSKRRKQLGIFRTYLIPKWTYESHEVCATLRQNIYYLMVVRLACVCVRLCIYKVCGCKRMRAFGRSLVRSFVCSYVRMCLCIGLSECFVGFWRVIKCMRVHVCVWMSICCMYRWKQSRAMAMTIAVVQSQISTQANDGM